MLESIFATAEARWLCLNQFSNLSGILQKRVDVWKFVNVLQDMKCLMRLSLHRCRYTRVCVCERVHVCIWFPLTSSMSSW